MNVLQASSSLSEPKKQRMLKRKLSKEEAKGEMKKTNLIINRSEEFTFYYKPGSDGVAALLGVRMLATLFGLQFKFVPANSCNDKRCLSAPAVKYKNNFVSNAPLIIYFLSSHNPQRKFNMIYAASTEEEDEDMSSRSTSAPKNKNNNVLSGNIVNTRSLSLPSKIQNLSLSDSLTFEEDTSQMDVLNILFELEQIVSNASAFVRHSSSKVNMDSYAGSTLACKFRSLNLIIIENWKAKGLGENIKIDRGKHGQNIVCELNETNKKYYFLGDKISCIDFHIVSFVIRLRLIFGKKIINGTLQHRGNILWNIYHNLRKNEMLNNILFDTDDMYLFEGYITDDEEDEEEDVNMR